MAWSVFSYPEIAAFLQWQLEELDGCLCNNYCAKSGIHAARSKWLVNDN